MLSDYNKHWEDKFKIFEWGKYPPEDLVRFIGRNFKDRDRKSIKVLEVGCGPGANLWFLDREGFQVHGIDISPTAIERAMKRLQIENGTPAKALDLKVGDFSHLPWEADVFDIVIDNFAIYANPVAVIKQAISEIYRVMKPGAIGFAKFWGINTSGLGEGDSLEERTFTNIMNGPCTNMGVAHFVDKSELEMLFSNFDNVYIDKILRTDSIKCHEIEEYLCQFQKAKN